MRSGYNYDNCDFGTYGLWRGAVRSAIRGKRGQSFLKELAAAMDAMPVKELIADELVDEAGKCCAIGSVLKARKHADKILRQDIDYEDAQEVAKFTGIAWALAAEIMNENDEPFYRMHKNETPAQRWERVRKWVGEKILTDQNTARNIVSSDQKGERK